MFPRPENWGNYVVKPHEPWHTHQLQDYVSFEAKAVKKGTEKHNHTNRGPTNSKCKVIAHRMEVTMREEYVYMYSTPRDLRNPNHGLLSMLQVGIDSSNQTCYAGRTLHFPTIHEKWQETRPLQKYSFYSRKKAASTQDAACPTRGNIESSCGYTTAFRQNADAAKKSLYKKRGIYEKRGLYKKSGRRKKKAAYA
ncbi:uncharacterized protein MYCFIDRAFT_180154 [Pseudocercospora fijiensis CIRAD86]|uniref:Uncharacterized protein n=1 Tax=Pseudocercospora fijiensis (strain CIRAD86) TaxID=383855 RepID=M2ZDG7_PSEFD|nr:uncharacterized protein MYCFIDRAFT_180154 [Pseudocercospora fijiensis CIRAD86]EME77149.1 hypothetical protein MYCFIDRAFT_180154 [Pseudocercospora fijiensis CIRAD86]